MTARDLLFFILGAAFGGGVTYLYMSREAEYIKEENTVYEPPKQEPKKSQPNESVQNEEAQDEKIDDEEIHKELESKKSVVPTETSSLDDYKAKEHLPKIDYFKIAGDYTIYEGDNGLTKLEKDFLENMNRPPERLSPEVWKAGINGPYEHVTLIYDPDTDTLTDEMTSDLVEVPQVLIGNVIEDSLFKFTDEQFIYVRNFRDQVDYEILKFNPKMVK